MYILYKAIWAGRLTTHDSNEKQRNDHNNENQQSIRYVENKQLATVAFFFVALIELARCWRGKKGEWTNLM